MLQDSANTAVQTDKPPASVARTNESKNWNK